MARYCTRLTDEQIFELFASRAYTADLDTGVIYGRNGKPLAVELVKRHYGSIVSERVELSSGKTARRRIYVHVLIWMLGNQMSVPKGFEIHHDDEDTRHNAFKNLFALAENDHRKLHGRSITDPYKEAAPF